MLVVYIWRDGSHTDTQGSNKNKGIVLIPRIAHIYAM